MTTIKPSLDAAARVAIAARTEAIFRRVGALREGHVQLESGRHGDAYLDEVAVLSDPAATSELVAFWAARHRDAEGNAGADLVAGAAIGGVVLAFELGRQLRTRTIFAEGARAADARTRTAFRPARRIEPGQRVLLVDATLTSTGSLPALLPAFEATGADIVECDVLVDLSGGMATLTSASSGRSYPLRSLWTLDLPTYEPGAATCPRCAAGEGLQVPGGAGTGASG